MMAVERNDGTLTVRPCGAMPARLERRQNGRHKATADAEANLSCALLPGSGGPPSRQGAVRPGDDRKLRGCDLVKIKIDDIVSRADIRTRAIVIQQKTGKPVQFELTADVRAKALVQEFESSRREPPAIHVRPARLQQPTKRFFRPVPPWAVLPKAAATSLIAIGRKCIIQRRPTQCTRQSERFGRARSLQFKRRPGAGRHAI